MGWGRVIVFLSVRRMRSLDWYVLYIYIYISATSGLRVSSKWSIFGGSGSTSSKNPPPSILPPLPPPLSLPLCSLLCNVCYIFWQVYCTIYVFYNNKFSTGPECSGEVCGARFGIIHLYASYTLAVRVCVCVSSDWAHCIPVFDLNWGRRESKYILGKKLLFDLDHCNRKEAEAAYFASSFVALRCLKISFSGTLWWRP